MKTYFENSRTAGATDAEAELAQTIGVKYAELCERLGFEGPWPPRVIAGLVLESHLHRERLRLDVLASFRFGDPNSLVRANDFAHDIAGILRGDEHQSARWALAYHPFERLPAAPSAG